MVSVRSANVEDEGESRDERPAAAFPTASSISPKFRDKRNTTMPKMNKKHAVNKTHKGAFTIDLLLPLLLFISLPLLILFILPQ